MKKKKLILTLLTSALVLSGCSVLNKLLDLVNEELGETTQSVTPTSQITNTEYNGDYYDSISSSEGNSLKQELISLNQTKLFRRIGYGNMGTNKYGYFRYTDYDPATTQYDENNKPYGTKIVGYYSNKSSQGKIGNNLNEGEMNREHVWPASKTVLGRNKDPLENDIHMVRPTFVDDNEDRGNSFYGTEVFDPGYSVLDYRGDAARIVFYCCIADSKLSLVDKNSDNDGNHTMGKLSDLLRWNLEYPVTDREERRNDGAQYLQGNRNPFIDHPEYACKIWGGYNSTTRSICGM